MNSVQQKAIYTIHNIGEGVTQTIGPYGLRMERNSQSLVIPVDVGVFIFTFLWALFFIVLFLLYFLDTRIRTKRVASLVDKHNDKLATYFSDLSCVCLAL